MLGFMDRGAIKAVDGRRAKVEAYEIHFIDLGPTSVLDHELRFNFVSPILKITFC
jgi:hypothetical protein